MANNEVRIIGGQWKGRKLKFPDRAGLRPTLGRVRETLFNWLAPRIDGARCLDLFAGSGALGFEALSRGAAVATFVERDRRSAAAIRANVTLLGAAARVVNSPAFRFVNADSSRYDIVFFDPPFGDARAASLLPDLLNRHLTEDGVIYVEQSRRDALPTTGRVVKHGTAGDCQYTLLVAGE